jgi:hypothetical protein
MGLKQSAGICYPTLATFLSSPVSILRRIQQAMGFFRFRRSFKILPGVRWNLNKRGSSFTFGGKGYRYTVGKKGSRTTVGLPGTGLSYTQVHPKRKTSRSTGSPPPIGTQPKPVSGKAGCVFALVAFFVVVWLLGHLNNSKLPQPSSNAFPNSSVTPGATQNAKPSGQWDNGSYGRSETQSLSADTVAHIQSFVPSYVTLRRAVNFPSEGGKRRTRPYRAASGSEVAVVRVSEEHLVVKFQGRQATVLITDTDFLDRVIQEADKSSKPQQ